MAFLTFKENKGMNLTVRSFVDAIKFADQELPLRNAIQSRIAFALFVSLFFAGCATPQGTTPSTLSNAREEIYVLRSIREQHVSSNEWCSQDRTGFAPLPKDADRKLSFWTVRTDPSDGKIVDAKANRSDDVRVCFGATSDRSVLNFYGEGTLGGKPYNGSGDCRVVAGDSPEKGMAVLRCFLTLRGLPAPYVGGLMLTSTIGSRAMLGGESDPPGYIQSSIATIRLWK
jgi:hypothetical protein